MTLEKKIIPGYLAPYKDELFSSWIIRNSNNHLIKPHSFTKFYFETNDIWNRDLDKWIPLRYKKILSLITPLSIDQVNNLFLSSYESIVYFGNITTSFTEGISNLGIYHRKRKRYGLLACPRCLAKEKYYKKEWRLLSTIVCIKCNSYLLEKCPKCECPIIFQRLFMGKNRSFSDVSISVCSSCFFDLSTYKFENEPSMLEIEYQNFINKLIQDKYNDKLLYSASYFKVLLMILRLSLTNSKKWNRVKVGIENKYKIQIFEGTEKGYFNYECKKILLPIIFDLLNDWPCKFVVFCKKYKIRYSDFSKDVKEMPYWFYNVFKECF